MASIELKALEKHYGEQRILKGIDLSVRDGEFISLVGASGCGKSTLLRTIAGLEQHSAGEMTIDGEPALHLKPAERDLAMVFQSYALYPHLSVFDNIAMPLRMRCNRLHRLPLIGRHLPGASRREGEIRAQVLQVAENLQITSLLSRKPGQLSGGQRQRVALGRAMVRKPRAFLMDEPLSNLDASLRVRMRQELVQMHRALGSTFIYVTHDQVEAMTMSDRVAVLMEGALVQVASPDELYRRPADIRVARFIGTPAINELQATVALDGRLCLSDITQSAPLGCWLPVAKGTRVTLAVRPEGLSCVPAGKGHVQGQVSYMENLGAEVLVQLSCENGQVLSIRATPQEGRELTIGQPLGVRIAADALHIFDHLGLRIDQPQADDSSAQASSAMSLSTLMGGEVKHGFA